MIANKWVIIVATSIGPGMLRHNYCFQLFHAEMGIVVIVQILCMSSNTTPKYGLKSIYYGMSFLVAISHRIT